MRLILLGSLFSWKKQLPVGGMPVYSQMPRSKSQQFSQLSIAYKRIVNFVKKEGPPWYLLHE